ncbi:hypothetical protein GALMADRAFT_240608 [Galerina marginata CBS 339.88]|uniref:Uncharacterized protein n=1 Tax=Galerina marginata (strain CBS 339.88) TaxID=685588 RepID=A0A067TQB9_GALM3|nr:hypothetical protein GALMADRAFT_240608 [Galerina marginata CBS 339.88]
MGHGLSMFNFGVSTGNPRDQNLALLRDLLILLQPRPPSIHRPTSLISHGRNDAQHRSECPSSPMGNVGRKFGEGEYTLATSQCRPAGRLPMTPRVCRYITAWTARWWATQPNICPILLLPPSDHTAFIPLR